jgi:predicted nuclease of predicted toxin-antitoxin system
MRFIVDAQLPVRLARFLHERGYDTLHTKDLPLQNATPDTYINNIPFGTVNSADSAEVGGGGEI